MDFKIAKINLRFLFHSSQITFEIIWMQCNWPNQREKLYLKLA